MKRFFPDCEQCIDVVYEIEVSKYGKYNILFVDVEENGKNPFLLRFVAIHEREVRVHCVIVIL